MTPPTLEHQRIVGRMFAWFSREWLHERSESARESGSSPAAVRQPDLTVWADDDAPQLVESSYCGTDGLLLAIEVVSPSSGIEDKVRKRAEYARAGIARYWIIEQDQPQTVTMLASTTRAPNTAGSAGSARLRPAVAADQPNAAVAPASDARRSAQELQAVAVRVRRCGNGATAGPAASTRRSRSPGSPPPPAASASDSRSASDGHSRPGCALRAGRKSASTPRCSSIPYPANQHPPRAASGARLRLLGQPDHIRRRTPAARLRSRPGTRSARDGSCRSSSHGLDRENKTDVRFG